MNDRNISEVPQENVNNSPVPGYRDGISCMYGHINIIAARDVLL